MLLYAFCDGLTGLILYTAVIFSPWAFGTTQPWAVWTLNGLSYALGVLWVITAIGRRCTSVGRALHRTSRPPLEMHHRRSKSIFTGTHAVLALSAVTILILAYCLISALNARATYLPEAGRSVYHECLSWLPHSLDSSSTWPAFWNYMALAACFWATRSWLLEEACPQRRQVHLEAERSDELISLPKRLCYLLWVLSVSGGLLAVESIIQRLAGSPKLLFLIQPQLHRNALSQFGPFAYRANAAEYFNLLWPVCFGFWCTIRETNAGGRLCLLGCAVVMAASPIISTSRGGAIISGVLMVATAVVTIVAESRSCLGAPSLIKPPRRWESPPFLIAAAILGLALGWNDLTPRLRDWQQGYTGREQLYDAARPIAGDFPIFGTGPGTYATVSELYRPDHASFWPAQVHNDWLEIRITFGWVGIGLLLASLLFLVRCGQSAGNFHVGSQLPVMTWLAMIGCLVHARFDFPFQVYSILHLFVILSALISVLKITTGHGTKPAESRSKPEPRSIRISPSP